MKIVHVGEVNPESARDFVEQTQHARHGELITLYLNSLGGGTCSGMAMMDMMDSLREHKGCRILIRVLGSAQSAAFNLLGAADHVEVSSTAFLMTHQLRGHLEGATPDEFQREYENYRHLDNLSMARCFQKATPEFEQQYRNKTHGALDWVLTPAEAKGFGIVDSILGEK